jgi:hypothetical protein
MGRLWHISAFALVLTACGRIGFEPRAGDAGVDAGTASDAGEDLSTFDASDAAATDSARVDMGIDAIVVSPSVGLRTTEAGGSDTFTIVLTSQPTSSVTVALTSSDTSEGTVSPVVVIFTPENWNAPRTVTVTGVDDAGVDGDSAYAVQTAPSVSADSRYNALDATDVSVTNIDDESAGVTVSRVSGLETTEAGGTDTFTIVLNARPTADVVVTLTSDATLEASVSPTTLTFTTLDWDAEQEVTATGVDDFVQDGNAPFTIVTSTTTSVDPAYAGIAIPDVSGMNLDDETPGIVVTPSSGLVTSESGDTATFSVVLQSEPASDVTVPVASSDASEGTVPATPLTFTPLNWNMPQPVVVTGADDVIVDGDQIYNVTVGPATSTDPGYEGLSGDSVDLTNSDDESAGFLVTPLSGLLTSEGGAVATYTVVLRSQPTASVIFTVESSDIGEGTVTPTTLVFTIGNWATPQTVTVTGVDDPIADGDQVYTASVSLVASGDLSYASLVGTSANVSVTNADDETAGIVVTPTTGLLTTEAGTTASFTVVLRSQPTASVSVALSSDTPSEGTASPASLVFSTVNWGTPQTVTVTGVADSVDDGDRLYQIVTANAVSADDAYNGLVVDDVTVTNTDDDTIGVTVAPTSGLVTGEDGSTALSTIALASEPTADVTFALASSDLTEGTVSPASVTFNAANWNVPRAVTVTGVDDLIPDGDIVYSVVTAAATSADSMYSGVNPTDVSVSNVDNDLAAVVVSPTSGLVTSEAGGMATFTVVLGSSPAAPVTISEMSSDATEGAVAPASLIFTNLNWNVPQTVTVTGVDDVMVDGTVAYSIVTGAASSADPAYSGLVVADVSASNTDNDAPSVTVTPTSGLVTTEALGTATFTVVLATMPSASVTISVTSTDTTEGTVSTASLVFTTLNWSTPQTVTLTGVDDALADGSVAYTITTGAAASADPSYSGLAVADVMATNTDNDVAGVTVTPTSGLLTTEAGGTATFTVVLTSMPTASVTISIASNDTTEGTVSPASLVFTTANWDTARTVTVTGVNDSFDDGNIAFAIVTGDGVSTDPSYSGRVIADVTVTNTDNDTAGATVTPTSGLVTTEAGGSASFTIVLTAQPTADVTISLVSSNVGEGTLVLSSVTFTTVNWNVARMITVTGVNDAVDDGNVPYSITTGAASSADAAYNGLAVSDVSVTNTDNDTAAVTVTPTSGLITTEAGTNATFTVVLVTQPTADVTISLTSSDTTEGTVSPASLTFTAMNWNAAQTVTVTGVDDSAADGNILYTIVTGAASSSDVVYNGMAVANVTVTNNDVLPYVQQAYVKASVASGYFGHGTALSADGNTMAVGGYREDSFTGAAYIFTRVAGVWTQQARITASNPDTGDFFGFRVELSADGDTLAVSAWGEASNAAGVDGNQANNAADNSGAVYVFTRASGVWTQQAYIKASNPDANDEFGYGLGLSSDGNTLAVGAWSEDGSAMGVNGVQNNLRATSGAVYAFTRTGVTWAQQAYVKASDTGGTFGFAVDVSGDGNTLAVGAWSEGSNATGINGDQADTSASSAARYTSSRARRPCGHSKRT